MYDLKMTSSGKIVSLDSIEKIKNIEDNEFMIKFYAPWCGSCKSVEEFYKGLPEEYPKVKFYQVDVSQHRKIGQEYNIGGIPTFNYYHNTTVSQTVGASESKVRALLS